MYLLLGVSGLPQGIPCQSLTLALTCIEASYLYMGGVTSHSAFVCSGDLLGGVTIPAKREERMYVYTLQLLTNNRLLSFAHTSMQLLSGTPK